MNGKETGRLSRGAIIEPLKNILLVVLVLSTILLLYFLWYDGGDAGFRVPSVGASENAETIPMSSVLTPESIVVNFGSENYTSLTETASLWYGAEPSGAPSFMGDLMRFLASDNVAVSAISKADFLDVMRARSIRADFAFDIPTIDFCAEFDLRRPAQIDVVETFTCVAYSEASPESLFLCNTRGDSYYRLAADVETGFGALITFVETFDNASYYPLRTFSGVENDTLLPLDADDAPEALLYERNPDPDDANDDARITAMTRGFFGNSFDFTRKITEGNGTTVYMYGYGEKVFVINRDGSFEYSADAGNAERSGVATMFGALTTALAFIASHDEPTGERFTAPKQIYLKDAQYTFTDGRGGYRFLFGVKINGYPVYYTDSEPLIVEVTGRQVNYYKRDMIDGILAGSGDAESSGSVFAPFELLAEHFAYIYNALSATGLAAPVEGVFDEEALFENVAGMVSGISPGLLRPLSDDARAGRDAPQSLLPVWMLTAGGVDFYFDIYTGAPAGYSDRE
jgi:hypothetical protein